MVRSFTLSVADWAMALDWEDLIRRWDILGSPGCLPKDRCIILCDQLSLREDGVCSAMQMSPESVSSEQIIRDFRDFKSDANFQEVVLKWEKPLPSCTK